MQDRDLVVHFDQPEAALTSLVGGKGKNLIALYAAGFPVPPGFVVTTEAFRLFVGTLPDYGAWLAKIEITGKEALRSRCDELRERARTAEVPARIQDAIRTALARLAAGAPAGSAAGPAFAVRSSSSLEDLAEAAFAGAHETYLNVRGSEAIIARVRDCFASLWEERAVLYRRHRGYPQREAQMAVVVQCQLECEAAGVAFSIDPVAGRLDRIVIDTNYGLGESVVSGECEVDHYELDKRSLDTDSQTIVEKTRMVVTTQTGVEEREVPSEIACRPSLDDAQARAVGDLARRVEAHHGWPQDIEWGWAPEQLAAGSRRQAADTEQLAAGSGRQPAPETEQPAAAGRQATVGPSLYLLQSRPVTTIQARWTRDESAERFPNPMTPLSWDFVSMAFRSSMAHSLALMGLPPFHGDWFEIFDDYVYGNQNAVDLIASYRPLRARNAQELTVEAPEFVRRCGWARDLPALWARDLDRYLIHLGRLSAFAVEQASPGRVWAHIIELLDVATEYFRPNIAISLTQALLNRLLHHLVGMMVGPERALAVVDGLMTGCETKTALVNRELHGLARAARADRALSRKLELTGGRGLLETHLPEAHPEFGARFRRFLDDHGHRELDMDYFQPTWGEQPWVVLDSIALIVRGDLAEDPGASVIGQRQVSFETERAFLATVPQELRFFFRELIGLARTYTILDDEEHYQTTRLNPIARRAAIALGAHLQRAAILDAPEDVFFFHKADLEELVGSVGRRSPDAYRERVYTARRSYEESWRRPPPWTLGRSEKEPAVPARAARGVPGSPGRVTGACFRVASPDDFSRFPKGAILVARTTNPAWTPLFYSASGLITESGGALSHGAITAREMRLPAVMSVRRAMAIFHDGQVVTLDGTEGTVSTSTGRA